MIVYDVRELDGVNLIKGERTPCAVEVESTPKKVVRILHKLVYNPDIHPLFYTLTPRVGCTETRNNRPISRDL